MAERLGLGASGERSERGDAAELAVFAAGVLVVGVAAVVAAWRVLALVFGAG